MPTSREFRGEERSGEAARLGDLIAGLFRRREFAGGVTVGRLGRRWEDVVGARLAAESAPAELRNGVLTILVRSQVWGTQLEFLREDVVRRVNEWLGTTEVRSVRVQVSPERLKSLRRTDFA